MILFKLFGALTLISVGGFFAYSAIRYERRRLSVLEGWIDLIRYVRIQIDCYLTPIDVILSQADRELFVACMCRDTTPTLHTLLECSHPYLSSECKRLLGGLIRELGSSYREEQLKRCEYYASELERHRDAIAKELPARIRLAVTLSLTAVLGTVILLW